MVSGVCVLVLRIALLWLVILCVCLWMVGLDIVLCGLPFLIGFA